jgi:phosphotransferase system HPr (HPr) family protein
MPIKEQPASSQPVGSTPGPEARVAARFTVAHARGLHLRVAARIALAVSPFSSSVTLTCGPSSAGGRSILALLTLQAGYGALVEVVAEGPDAQQCVTAVGEVICDAGRT